MTVATYEDVATALGRTITDGDEAGQIDWWLTGIELLIANRLGPVANLDQAAVRYVEAEAAAAKVRRNGQTESSITVSVDDGNVTRRWDQPASADDITDEWWGLLAPKSESNAFSTRPGYTPDICWPRPHMRTTY